MTSTFSVSVCELVTWQFSFRCESWNSKFNWMWYLWIYLIPFRRGCLACRPTSCTSYLTCIFCGRSKFIVGVWLNICSVFIGVFWPNLIRNDAHLLSNGHRFSHFLIIFSQRFSNFQILFFLYWWVIKISTDYFLPIKYLTEGSHALG